MDSERREGTRAPGDQAWTSAPTLLSATTPSAPSQWLCPGRVSRCSIANNKPDVTATLGSHDGGREGVGPGTPKHANGGGGGHQHSLSASPSLLCFPISQGGLLSLSSCSPHHAPGSHSSIHHRLQSLTWLTSCSLLAALKQALLPSVLKTAQWGRVQNLESRGLALASVPYANLLSKSKAPSGHHLPVLIRIHLGTQ